MGTQLDIDDVAAQSPLAQRELAELRERLAFLHAQKGAMRRKINPTHRWSHSSGLKVAHAMPGALVEGRPLCGLSRWEPWGLGKPLSRNCTVCERIADKRKIWVK